MSTTTQPCDKSLKGIRGEALTFVADPFINSYRKCYRHWKDALIVVSDGRIIDIGNYDDIAHRHPQLTDIDTYTDALIMPGFIDCHVHYVQVSMLGSYGDTLLNWLDSYTFPTEANFAQKDFAEENAKVFFRQILSQGTTTANVFATTFETSVDAFFEESERYNTRMISGKVLQDRNLPDNLKDPSPEESIALSEKLLKKWHGRGRQMYAIIPRFAPTCSETQLRLAGELYRRYINKGVYMHTHLDEAPGEIEWVKELFPDSENYTEVYRRFGLIDRRSVMAHCCLVKEEEWQLLHNHECGVAHCPSSNLFLGGGQFKYWEAKRASRPCRVGIGTDVGGGTNFSIPRQLGEAYKVAMLQQRSINAEKCFYLATRGGAEALHLENTIGTLSPGFEADIAVIDLKPTEYAEWRLGFTKNIFDKLFVLQTLGVSSLIKATYVAGKKVYDIDRDEKFKYADSLR